MSDVRTIRVFIASPNDLAVERAAFKQVLEELNAGFGDALDITFEPLGWEDTLASTGRRSQEVVNREIDRCDVIILACTAGGGRRLRTLSRTRRTRKKSFTARPTVGRRSGGGNRWQQVDRSLCSFHCFFRAYLVTKLPRRTNHRVYRLSDRKSASRDAGSKSTMKAKQTTSRNPPPSDHEHFLSLLESHQRPLLKVCWAYGRTSHDRDDLLQEIVGRLWAAFGAYDRSRKFSTWMFRVALNVAIDFRRSQRRWGRETVSLDDGGDTVPDAATDDAAKRQQLRELRELLEQQSDEDRPLLLLYLEGHSYREIGDVLGISESNVGTRLNRLKNSLRQSVQEASDEQTGERPCNSKNFSSNGSGSIRSSINR